MQLKLITPPALEPVTLAEAKLHLRVDLDADDTLVAAQIAAARQDCEAEIDRSFLATTWELLLDEFPGRCRPWGEGVWSEGLEILLPRPTLMSVTSVSYVDADGNLVVLDAEGYQACGVGTRGQGYLVPAFGTSWPATRSQPEAVRVRFVSGYGETAADVPACVRAAILLWVGHLYENREATVAERASFVLPMGVKCLLSAEGWGGY